MYVKSAQIVHELNWLQVFTRLSEQSFNSDRKYMAVSGIHTYSTALYSGTPREIYYIKGAIEAVLDRCKFYYVSDSSTPALDSNTRNVILSNAQVAAAKGLRILAMAYGYGSVDSPKPDTSLGSRSAPQTRSPSPDPEKSGLIFVGFQAMFDPPRKGVADAIGLLQSGGVQVVMITGDAEPTALAIARKLGLRVGQRIHAGSSNQYCMTGKEIDQISKAQLVERVGSVSVFARTTPRHKMAIVEAFQARGAVVAMTGDGG
jgi:Ca2+-transporting ATPase